MKNLTFNVLLTCLLVLGLVGLSLETRAGDETSTTKEATMGTTMDTDKPAGESQDEFRGPIRSKDNQLVTISTNYGDMTLELWKDVAPAHADSFAARASDHFYDSLIFHRVMDGFMIQGGCPKKNGTGNAGYFLQSEFNDNLHVEGTLSMARSRSPHSASCQFFICLGPTPQLNNEYTVFGHLIKGYDVLRKIGKVQVKPNPRGESSVPLKEVTMEKVFLSDADGNPLKQ